MQAIGAARVNRGRTLGWLSPWLIVIIAAMVPAPAPAQEVAPAQDAAPAPEAAPAQVAPRAPVIYVARRGWHIDIGFAAADIKPPLNALAAEFPGLRYLFIGFGDQQYLLAKQHNAPVLLAALWPGRAMLLATGLSVPPQAAFGAAQVAVISVTPQQLTQAQAFIWQSLDRHAGPKPAARGPYAGSLYFTAGARYSALHTCNTWAAEALKSAALPVHSGGVVFAGQLWVQVRRLMSTERSRAQLQGGFDPS